MKIMELIKRKAQDNMNNGGVTIAFLGDSVTQGCFEIYMDNDGEPQTIFNSNYGYHNALRQIFAYLYPSVPVNIINSGISGDNAPHALGRLHRDVIRYSPDLVVVCFGLNDCFQEEQGIPQYIDALGEIFNTLKEKEIDVIFMTPNIMNSKISPLITERAGRELSQTTMKLQNDGTLDAYIAAAKKLCQQMNVPVCDCYAKWKKLQDNGVDTTELLANRINHPRKEMNWMFAIQLFETIIN